MEGMDITGIRASYGTEDDSRVDSGVILGLSREQYKCLESLRNGKQKQRPKRLRDRRKKNKKC